MKNKQTKSSVAGVIVWSVVSVVLVAILAVVTVLENTLLEPIITTVLGGPTPIKGKNSLDIYSSDYSSKEEVLEAGNALNEEIAKEGFVLLVNEDNALPISTPQSDSSVSQKPKVSVFGKNSVNIVYGGSGSGGGDSSKAATIFDGLELGGFEYNPVLRDFYESSASGSGRSENPTLSDSSSAAPTLDIGETPVASYTAEVKSSFSDYSDAAIVVISRVGGESFDLPRTQNTENGGIEGNHYLQLDKNEYDMLDMVTSRFDKVIVVLNTLTAFQCDFIAEYNNTVTDKRIDAVIWVGGPGVSGMNVFGDLLNGNVNPSGKTVDIYASDYTKDPTWQNFGDGTQVNGGKNNTAFLQNGTAVGGQNMVAYEEGVYIGYRYYETRAYEESQASPGSKWYEENVVFPFGYGLSYTAFRQTITEVNGSLENGDKLEIVVSSENIGDVAGKDVIELYVTKPYTYGGIEKSYVELVDFAKTDILEKGESYSVTFTVDPYMLASYDYNDANNNGFCGYELEAGDYIFTVSRHSHITDGSYDSETVALSEGYNFAKDPVTTNDVVNRYTTDDYNSSEYRLSDVTVRTDEGTVTRKGMSRTDFAGTFPTPLTAEEREVLSDEKGGLTELDALRSFEHNNTEIGKIEQMPVTGADSDIVLRDLLAEDFSVNYNDGRWEELLNKLTFQEMLDLVNNGAFQTSAMMSIGKNLTNDSDGPIGFVNFMPGMSARYSGNPTFATEIVIGSSWNKDLAYRMGKMVGESGLFGDVNGNGLPYSGWYAPAVNLHRSPFAGRNFEYYSEDPVLSGKLAVNVINGAATKGVYTDVKHFALNDQETNRAGIATYCTEQALRELYLRPFEMAVKGLDDASCVTSAKDDGITEYRGTTGMMSSFNRIGTRWTGGDYRLLTEILRNEWGYKGLVICDYKTDNSFMNSRQMLYAGNDLILASVTSYMWQDASSSSAQDVTILRQATKNILYTVANSNSVAIEIVGYSMEWWKVATIVLDCVAVVGLAVWGFFAVKKYLKKRNAASA